MSLISLSLLRALTFLSSSSLHPRAEALTRQPTVYRGVRTWKYGQKSNVRVIESMSLQNTKQLGHRCDLISFCGLKKLLGPPRVLYLLCSITV